MNTRGNVDYTIIKDLKIMITIENDNINVYRTKNNNNDDIFLINELELINSKKLTILDIFSDYAIKVLKKEIKVKNLTTFKRELHNYDIKDNVKNLVAYYYIKSIKDLI